MSTAQELFDSAFSVTRDPRSDAYRHGVLDILKYKLREINPTFGKSNYVMGTAEADAYYAGCDEGHRIAREYMAEQERQFAEAERISMNGTFGGR